MENTIVLSLLLIAGASALFGLGYSIGSANADGHFYELQKIRNNDVCRFRTKLLEVCSAWSATTLWKESGIDKFYRKLPSYNEMLYSTTPLTPENWFSEEDYKTLFGDAIGIGVDTPQPERRGVEAYSPGL